MSKTKSTDHSSSKNASEVDTQTSKQSELVTVADVYARLKTVIDPELHVNIVALGLIYDVQVSSVMSTPKTRGVSGQTKDENPRIHIVMTLTTPGCPLASVFDRMLKDSLYGLPGVVPERDVTIELTFDPPWIIDMMDPETKAQLGF